MSGRLTHIFLAKLKTEVTREEILVFLEKTAQILPQICGVQCFRMFERKAAYHEYLFYMEFEDQKSYERYNAHPMHEEYVRDVWSKVAGTVEVIELHEIGADSLRYEGGYNG